MIHTIYELLTYLWLTLAILFLALEMLTPGLFLFLSFTAGALTAALASWGEYSLMYQLAGALITTCLTLFTLSWHFRQSRTTVYANHFKSNGDALIGKKALVMKPLTQFQMGTVKINGELWSAQSPHSHTIEQGAEVEIVAIKGAHVIVKKLMP